MKTTRFLNMMAASLVGVAFMSCSSQDDVLTPAGQTYTMSVKAQKGGDETRALNLDGTTLKATWTEGDVVKVYNSTPELIGTLTAQSAGATTTLTGDLTKLPTTGDELTLKYLSPSYSTQDGTLTGTANSIDKVCDYATATVTATVSGTNVTTGAATFQNQQAVVKFTLKDKDGNALPSNPTAFTINDGTDDIVKLTDIPAGTYSANGEGVLYVAIPGFTEKTITLTATVGTDTYTCTASSKTLENGNYYGVTAKMAKQAAVPEGAISGKFTVNGDGKQVYFSKGNLQYDANATTKWYFAANQWDYIGTATGYPMDHFTWGNIDSPTYNGTTGLSGSSDLSGNTDWGSNIGSGWYTLSEAEWTYLLNTRTVNGYIGKNFSYTQGQTVNGVLGVVLYPDGYTGSTYTTGSDWSTFEAKGCVFLPAAGNRDGTTMNVVGECCDYWTRSASAEYARKLRLDSEYKSFASEYRSKGMSVRLVKDVAASSAPAVPAGALNGEFSVSDTKKVKFSKGNLKYNGSTWSFFDNQYDYYTTHDGTNWDKFCWSTSATTYGMNTSESEGTYSGDFVDWGSNSELQSALGTGWRTLTSGIGGEWRYLFYTRSASTVNGTANARYAKAKVCNVQGVILFPDAYTHPSDVTTPTGINVNDNTGWNGNNYSSADWEKMESAGCVFLPAAGDRYGSSVYNLGTTGYYWSATPLTAVFSLRVYFNSGSLNPADDHSRNEGYSVRLVRDVE